MGAFDPGPVKGIPYHLRPSTPEELATHKRLISKMEALKKAYAERHNLTRGTENHESNKVQTD